MDPKTQLKTDKFAATISLACAVHCFFVPSFFIVTSGFVFTSIDNELIHKMILLIALPVSLYALSLGYKNHNNLSFLYIGISLLVIGTGFFKPNITSIISKIYEGRDDKKDGAFNISVSYTHLTLPTIYSV